MAEKSLIVTPSALFTSASLATQTPVVGVQWRDLSNGNEESRRWIGSKIVERQFLSVIAWCEKYEETTLVFADHVCQFSFENALN